MHCGTNCTPWHRAWGPRRAFCCISRPDPRKRLQRSTSLRVISPRSAMVEAAPRLEGRHDGAVVGLVEPKHESAVPPGRGTAGGGCSPPTRRSTRRMPNHAPANARIRDDAFWLSQRAEAKGVAAQLEHGRRLFGTPPRLRHDAHAAEYGGWQVGSCAGRSERCNLGRGRNRGRSPDRPRRRWLCGRRGNRRAGLTGNGGGRPAGRVTPGVGAATSGATPVAGGAGVTAASVDGTSVGLAVVVAATSEGAWFIRVVQNHQPKAPPPARMTRTTAHTAMPSLLALTGLSRLGAGPAAGTARPAAATAGTREACSLEQRRRCRGSELPWRRRRTRPRGNRRRRQRERYGRCGRAAPVGDISLETRCGFDLCSRVSSKGAAIIVVFGRRHDE